MKKTICLILSMLFFALVIGGIYPIMVETEKQMVDEIIRLSKDADYYLTESQKGLRYRKDTGLFEY